MVIVGSEFDSNFYFLLSSVFYKFSLKNTISDYKNLKKSDFKRIKNSVVQNYMNKMDSILPSHPYHKVTEA